MFSALTFAEVQEKRQSRENVESRRTRVAYANLIFFMTLEKF